LPRIRAVLVEPEYAENIGGICRVMKNFGLEELWLVNPKVRDEEVIRRRAVRAQDVVDRIKVVERLEDAIRDADLVVGTTATAALDPSNLRRVCISPAEFAGIVGAFEGLVALLFGKESIGLKNEEIEKCEILVSIPSSPEYRALNVVVAAGIILYELYKAGGIEGLRAAPKDLRNLLIRFFSEIVYKTNLSEVRKEMAVRAFKNFVSRALITEKEASLLVGSFRRVLKKIELLEMGHGNEPSSEG